MSVNIALNSVSDKISLHKLGLSDSEVDLRIEVAFKDNLGVMRISERVRGELIQLKTGDSILADEKVSFIKLDVEGHETAVPKGLEKRLQDVGRCCLSKSTKATRTSS